MYHLDIISKITEPEPDGTIRIRPGESTIVRIDERTPQSSAPDIRGRPAEWKVKTIPALIIVISDDLDEIFKVFQALEDRKMRFRSSPYLPIWTGYFPAELKGRFSIVKLLIALQDHPKQCNTCMR